MADNAAACPACGELRYQQPVAAQPQQPQYAAPQAAPQPQYQQQQAYGQQQQQAYAQPQAGAAQPQFAVPVSADEAKGFIGALFDLSFSNFITIKMIKVLYIIVIIGAVLEALAVAAMGLRGGAMGLVMVVLAPVAFFAILILGRVYMELVMVIFKAEGHLHDMVKLMQTKR